MTLTIRPEAAADVDAIRHVTAAAFEPARHTSHTEHFIVDALRRAGHLSISLVAEEDGRIVGHVALSPVELSTGAAGWFGLGPISVMPDCQGRGVGSALMHAALAELRRRGAAGCVLVGEPGYYERFGFAARSELVLAAVPPEYFLALSFTGQWPSASVRFSEAFEAKG